MAPSQPAPSFNAIIEAGRKRKKHEDLANEIFSRGRKANTLSTRGKPNAKASPSLASRITKPTNRSVSASSFANTRGQFKGAISNAETRSGPVKRDLFEQVVQNPVKAAGNGFTIRGLAGPYVVIASNFAPGTTSADIQSAMEAVAGPMEACNILTSAPTVIAEMVFSDMTYADAVISTFNNQKADGRLLHLYLKGGPPTAVVPQPQPIPRPISTQPKAVNSDRSYSEPTLVRPVLPIQDKVEPQAEPEVQDGSYGFENRGEAMEVESEKPVDVPTEPRYDNQQNYKPIGNGGDRRPDRFNNWDGYRFDTRRAPDNRPREYGQRNDYRGDNRTGNRGGRDDRGLYSDNLYRHPRGNGYR